MKTLKQLLRDKGYIDREPPADYAILQENALKAVEEWLEQKRQDSYWELCNNPQHVFEKRLEVLE